MNCTAILRVGVLLVAISPAVAAQNRDICGTPSLPPDVVAAIEEVVQEFRPSNLAKKRIQIPVAFHVVHSGSNGQVTDAQIKSLIKNLNTAFDDTFFSFFLQHTDRTNSAAWYANCGPRTVNDQQMKQNLSRDPRHVLNIYSCVPGSNLIGFASFPFLYAESSFLHGVTLHPTVLPGGSHPDYGTFGLAGAHEVGHYLGLFHTFEGGCSDGDFVADTPAQAAPHFGCPSLADSCPSTPGRDDTHNFMNYSNDRCMRHFTQGQISRMTSQTRLFRPSLGVGAECFPELPSPRLTISATERYVVRGKKFTRYLLKVSNSSSFPNALFAMTNQPCGSSKKSSRTWVTILDEQNRGIYGFCGLSNSGQLNDTWFAIAQGEAPPKSVYIRMEDMECGLTYESNLALVPR